MSQHLFQGVEGLTLPLFHKRILLTPGFISENEEISAPPPFDLEYINFIKIGQPKLSERVKEAGCLLDLQRVRIGLRQTGEASTIFSICSSVKEFLNPLLSG
jgi:hypothetical protein